MSSVTLFQLIRSTHSAFDIHLSQLRMDHEVAPNVLLICSRLSRLGVVRPPSVGSNCPRWAHQMVVPRRRHSTATSPFGRGKNVAERVDHQDGRDGTPPSRRLGPDVQPPLRSRPSFGICAAVSCRSCRVSRLEV